MPEAQIVHSQLPTVAIVGRPNVGKSTLFNRIVGRRKAVVLDTPGVTRDRNFEVAEWEGRRFNLVDTGGYETEPRDITFDQMRRQSLMAIQEADVVLFLTDVRETDNPVDQDVVNILRRSQKPVIIAANKCDNTRLIQEAYSFYNFGIEDLLTISAANGTYVAELLDRIVELLPERSESERPFDMGVRIAVVGRPNVGKSTLINSLLGYERVVATPLPAPPATPSTPPSASRTASIHSSTRRACAGAARSSAASRSSAPCRPRPASGVATWSCC